MSEDMYQRGMAIRRAVLGDAHVDAAMNNADEFTLPIQQMATEYAWGAVWGREGLDRKLRSVANLAMLTALNQPHELKAHVKGALRNGLTKLEIRELLLHATAYCGMPAGLAAFRVAREAIAEVEAAEG